MPSWNALPFELKLLVFDQVLENALGFDHAHYGRCLPCFPHLYVEYEWDYDLFDLKIHDGPAFIHGLSHCRFTRNRMVYQCLTKMAQEGWLGVENFLAAAPEMEMAVHARFEKEFLALRATASDDHRRFSFTTFAAAKIEQRTADAIDGIKKEVMKYLCYHSWMISGPWESVEQEE